jgi:hypothetical protein
MKRQRLASLVLATVLPWLPLVRCLAPWTAASGAPWAVVLRWAVGLAALAGSCHAVSAASASLSGLTRYVNNQPSGNPTNVASGRVGTSFTWRITVKDAGVNPESAFYDCRPLPPGLVLNTNAGASGLITGTPTASGTFPVTLIAGNTLYVTPATAPDPTPVTSSATIIISPPPQPPTIESPPAPLAVVQGASAVLDVAAAGTAPLRFQWLQNSRVLPGKTNAVLAFGSAAATNAGNYSVQISNPDGTVTSPAAALTVLDPAVVQLRLSRLTPLTNSCFCSITGPTNLVCIVWFSSNLSDWLPIATNQLTNGTLSDRFAHPKSPFGGYYRVSNQP